MNAIKRLLLFSVLFFGFGLSSQWASHARETAVLSFGQQSPLSVPHYANPDWGLSEIEIVEGTEKRETSHAVGLSAFVLKSGLLLARAQDKVQVYQVRPYSRLFILYHNLRN